MLNDRCDPKMNKEQVTQAIARALLKRRITNLLTARLRGTDLPDEKYMAGYAPSQVFGTIFCSIAAFRASQLHETTYMALPWVSQLPSWQADAVQFAAKLLRGSNAVDKKLDEALAMDPLIPAETLFQSPQWQTAQLFDFKDILDQRKAAMEPPAPKLEAPKQEEPEPAKPDPAPPVDTVDNPHEPEAMPHVMAEVPEEEVPSGPAPVDRLSFFSMLDIPSDIASTLQGGDDCYFEQVLDWARVKVNTFVELEIKSPTAQGKRNQVAALYSRNGGTSLFIIYDVKCRLHIKDDLLVNPWRRPTPLNAAEFKQWLSAFWLDPKVTLSSTPICR